MKSSNPKQISFHKMHGLGNDFILLDHLFHQEAGVPSSFPSAKQVQFLCDRRFGIGADGVLRLTRSLQADAKFEIWNQDGSTAEMCGNGLRCAAQYIWDHSSLSNPLFIETQAGILSCTMERKQDQETWIEIRMGKPKFQREQIPMMGIKNEEVENEWLVFNEQRFLISAVSMGNPHVVIFTNPSDHLHQLAKIYGPLIENHPLFPQKTNVNFAKQRGPFLFDLVVWERGCGITQACGTATSATITIACKRGLCSFDTWVAVKLPGGILEVKVLPHFQDVLLKGPATYLFQGFLSVDSLPPEALY